MLWPSQNFLSYKCNIIIKNHIWVIPDYLIMMFDNRSYWCSLPPLRVCSCSSGTSLHTHDLFKALTFFQFEFQWYIGLLLQNYMMNFSTLTYFSFTVLFLKIEGKFYIAFTALKRERTVGGGNENLRQQNILLLPNSVFNGYHSQKFWNKKSLSECQIFWNIEISCNVVMLLPGRVPSLWKRKKGNK